ncbi:MAG: DUF2442 domain-containing protein [Bacteroidales bacterium]|nr:DUF2442 domain-containing protein [Bacteroidales bacterium]
MKIVNAKYLGDYKIEVTFYNDEIRIVDFKNFIHNTDNPSISQFKDIERFKRFELIHGFLSWEDGTMDISGESIYNNHFE